MARPSALDEEKLVRGQRMREARESLRQISRVLEVGVATVHRGLTG